jgi:transglutaminase-like putative cysteine protease
MLILRFPHGLTSKICLGHGICVLLAFSLTGIASAQDGTSAKAGSTAATKQRAFQLDYGAKLTELSAGGKVRVWLPVPQSDEYQRIQILSYRIPGKSELNRESKFGNQILYFETTVPESGEIAFSTSYHVQRREVRGLAEKPLQKPALSESERKQALAADAKVPISGRPLTLLEAVKLPNEPLSAARVIYDVVDEHVKYDKSRPGYGNGDVLWVCDSRFGNCTDFHSLFMSLARSQGIPARFEIGFPLPPERGDGLIGGYHCWAYFHVDGRGWVPVDISEADKHPAMKDYYFGNLTEDRVTFSTGRDIDLIPRQDGPALNFFIYPYAEIDGKVLPKDNIKPSFSFVDR